MSRDSGSFRDPSGYVFQHAGRIFRALDRASAELLRGLDAQGHLARWAQAGLVVGTRFVADAALQAQLAALHPGFEAFLEHDRISPITYPYEWSTSMLADAGRPWAYAHGMARHMFKVTRVEWCNADQLGCLIAALEYDARRRAAKAQDGR